MRRSHSIANPEYRSDIVDRTVKLIRATERAVLCRVYMGQGAGEDEWFPLSQVEIAANSDGSHTLSAPEWLLVEKGWL